MSSELKVGIFTALALGILAYMIIATGSCNIWFGEKEGLKATAVFRSIAGLEKKAAVRIAGVRVGDVTDISLNANGIAEVKILIVEPVKLRTSATAAVSSLGLMGEKYVEIFPGNPGDPEMISGAVIQGKEPLSIDQMGAQILSISSDIKELTSSLSSVLGSKEGQAKLNSIVTNFSIFTQQLQTILSENRAAISEFIHNGSNLTVEVRDDFVRLSAQFDKLLVTVQGMLDENRGNIRTSTSQIVDLTKKLQETSDTLNSILKKIDTGEGTLGKLINEPTTHDKLNQALDQMDKSLKDVSSALGKVGGMPSTKMGLRSEYLLDSQRAKTYLSFGIQSKKNRYFLMELVHDPIQERAKKTTVETPDGTTMIRTVTTRQAISINAQGGLFVGHLGIRGGLTESTAGVGIDYSLAKDRIKFTVDGYDFGRDDQPHLKIGSRLGIYKQLYLTVGSDDMLLDKRRQFYFGFGVGSK